MTSFFSELKRRNVFKIGVAYAIVAWLIVQVVSAIHTPLHLPGWFDTVTLVSLGIGFPIALIITWAFELTPEGVKRTEPGPDKLKAVNETKAITSSAASDTPSIAVLPFADMSPDKDQEYFADGMTEEILNSLARIQDLQVSGRTSSFYFKDKNEDFRIIAEKLGVENILEGSIRKAGDQLRITAQLINARSGYHLWSKTYDCKLDDIFAIQENIARAVADALQITLGIGDLGRVEGGTRNVEAYNELLQGRALSRNRTREPVLRAIDHFERAIELDPGFALPWAALSDAYSFMPGVVEAEYKNTWMDKQSAALSRARELAPQAPAILAATAVDFTRHQRWLDAERILENLIKGNRKVLTELDYCYGFFLDTVGRPSEAIEYGRRFLRAEPLDPYAVTLLGVASAAAGDIPGALATFEDGIARIGGQSAWPYGSAVNVAMATDDHELIKRRVTSLIKLDPIGGPVHTAMLALMDDRLAALAELRRIFATTAVDIPLQRFVIASWAAHFDDAELALEALEDSLPKFIEIMSQWTQPLFRDVRRLPGFKKVLRETGLVDYWRSTGNWGEFCRPVGDDDFECI